MTDSKPQRGLNHAFHTHYKQLLNLAVAHKNGASPKTGDDIRFTCTLQRHDVAADIKSFVGDALIGGRGQTDRQRQALQDLLDNPTLTKLRAARRAFMKSEDIVDRLDVYLSIFGDADAIVREINSAVGWQHDRYHTAVPVHQWIWVFGLLTELLFKAGDLPRLEAIKSSGVAMLAALADSYADLNASMKHSHGGDERGVDALYAALRGAALDEDRSEIDPDFQTDEAPVELETMQVMGRLDPSTMSASRKDQTRSIIGIASRKLPIPAAPAHLGDWAAELRGDFPHLGDVIDRVGITLGTMRSVRGLRLLFVGPPGGGKTSLAQGIFESLQVPHTVFGCGGVADSAFAGTSAQWASARASFPLQQIAIHGCAGVGIVLDEVDKIGSSRQNGSLGDALLGFLEPASSRKIVDPLLEQPVDLSAVNYIATANELSDVPRPLRDRFKIIEIPAAGWQQVGALSASILRRLARADGDHPGHYVPFAQDEIDLLAELWKDGSIRTLEQVVESMAARRQRMMRRH